MFDYSPEYAFDGVVDLWFNKRMPDQYKAEVISIYESFNLEVNVVAKKDAEVRLLNKKRNLVPDNRSVNGIFFTPKDIHRPNPVAKIWFNYHKARLQPIRNVWLTHHEIGHAFGLDHAFDLDVSETVMNYPQLFEWSQSSTAMRLTPRDRDLITGILCKGTIAQEDISTVA